MKNTFASLLIVVLFGSFCFGQDFNLKEELERIPAVKRVQEIESVDHFTKNFEFWYEQHTIPGDLKSPTFLQRCFIGHVDKSQPVIVELEGYGIYSSKAGELTKKFKANQLTIEHRYFANSKPNKKIPWHTLTTENAAHDHHVIIQAIRGIYRSSKFISTGISKGGTTTMIHRSNYPEDVDGSVCYVAPLVFEREDPRIYTFLDTVGTAEQRQKIEDFQLLCFENEEVLIPIFELLSKQYKWNWSFDSEKAFEYFILEYSFAFWQWGSTPFDSIPDENETALNIVYHLLDVGGVSFFEDKGVKNNHPYFYAAMTEIGIYGYRTEKFKKYLEDVDVYKFDFALPKHKHEISYDNTEMLEIQNYLDSNANNMIFIYGGADTWTASAVNLKPSTAEERNIFKYIKKGGHHGTRINSFKPEVKKLIYKEIESWIDSE